MAQTVYIGKGTIGKLEGILSNINPDNIFLVTGKASYESSGAKATMDGILEPYKTVHFSDFQVNPQVDDVKKGVEVFNKNKCDFVVAIGGGSVMDIAKLINVFSVNEGNSEEYILKKKSLEKEGYPIVAIPTTSGSGSEATHFAVVYIDKIKYSLAHEKFMLPNYVIVDTQLTLNLPPNITASSGMDALSQAIESYWGIYSNEESREYAKEAIELIINNLRDAVNNPDEKSRENMAKAAHLAGKAINISKTTVPHAISYPITSYFNVSHGHAVALTLPHILDFNAGVTESDCLDPRGVDYAKKTIQEIVGFLGVSSVIEAKESLIKLMQDIGLSTKLNEVGITTDEDIEVIIKNGFDPDRVRNNQRILTEDTLREILHSIK